MVIVAAYVKQPVKLNTMAALQGPKVAGGFPAGGAGRDPQTHKTTAPFGYLIEVRTAVPSRSTPET